MIVVTITALAAIKNDDNDDVVVDIYDLNNNHKWYLLSK